MTDINSPTPAPDTTVLITGANKGLGRETARRLSALGWTILLGARDPELGRATAAELSSGGGDVRFVAIDVTSDDSVAAAVEAVGAEVDHLDVLINNAGIIGSFTPVVETGPTDFLACFGVNVLGPVRVTRAFLPLLQRSANPRIVMVSSGLGSMTLATDADRIESSINSLVYPSSKSALNMVTVQYAKALPTFRINAVDPGYTATDLNRNSGHQTVEEGTDAIVRLATVGDDGPTGGFFDRNGTVAW